MTLYLDTMDAKFLRLGASIFAVSFSLTTLVTNMVSLPNVAIAVHANISGTASQLANLAEAFQVDQIQEPIPETLVVTPQEQSQEVTIPIISEPVSQPAQLQWNVATMTAEWSPRDSAASFIFHDKMWIVGGVDGNGTATNDDHNVHYWEATHLNDIWSSADGVSWTRERAHATWSVRRSMSVVPFGGSLWMFGGWSPTTGYTSDVWKSEDGIAWKLASGTVAWEPREGQTAVVFNDRLWLMGGVNYDERSVKNDVWYTEDGINWIEASWTIPWSPRWDHAVTEFKGKLFLSGGMNLKKDTFNDVWESLDGVHWTLVTDSAPWQSRQGHGLVVLHDLLWTVGRLNDNEGGGVNDVWFSEDGKSWTKTDSDPEWLGREDHGVLLFKDRIYVLGGMDSNWEWRNDVWVGEWHEAQ